MSESIAVSVSHLTAVIRGALAASPQLEDVLVEGEVSNLSTPVSGHVYFTLKDATSNVRCVVFRTAAQRIPFRLENGMTIFVHGHVDIYEAAGQYQLYGDRVEPSGVGALALAIEQTRRRLAAEGLFDEARKRPLPVLPRRVVVVTSRTGAAWRDVTIVMGRRAPIVDIVLSPASVQGDVAVDAIVTALDRAGKVVDADVVLLVRGGGSIEDLAAFSDERVVRAVRNCQLPVVAGIGHETDLSLAELAADVRAATPSAAAEIAVPSVEDLRRNIEARRGKLDATWRAVSARGHDQLRLRIRQLEASSPHRQVAARRAAFMARVTALRLASPHRRVLAERENLHRKSAALDSAAREVAGNRRQHLAAASRHLEALSPRRILERGFSITLDASGAAVQNAASVGAGDELRTVLADGEVTSTVMAPTSDN